MQLPAAPGQVLVGAVALARQHVVAAVERAEGQLHLARADVLAAHQVVHQLVVVATRAHGAAHRCYHSAASPRKNSLKHLLS